MINMEQIDTDKRRKDGAITNFAMDDSIEELLNNHFAHYQISPLEVSKNFSLYARRIFIKRFLAHYELFSKTVNLPGENIWVCQKKEK